MTIISRHHIKNFRRSEPRRGAFFYPLLIPGILTVLVSALLPMLVNAASDRKPNSLSLDDARWFQVELVLFAHKKGEPLESEQWPEIIGLSLPESLLELHLPVAEPPADADENQPGPGLSASLETSTPDLDIEPPGEPSSDGLPELPVAYQLLGENALQLTEARERIDHSSRYNTLLHVAWQQPTVDREHAQPIFFMQGMSDPLPVENTSDASDEMSMELPSTTDASLTPLMEFATEEDTNIGPADPQFVGTVTLSVERYLHLAIDLLFRQPVTQHLAIPIPDLELWYDRPYPTLKEPQGPAYQQESWQAVRGFRFLESRRMRSKEIHYLDNPLMGLVVLITPVELPEPAEEIQQTLPQNILQTPRK